MYKLYFQSSIQATLLDAGDFSCLELARQHAQHTIGSELLSATDGDVTSWSALGSQAVFHCITIH